MRKVLIFILFLCCINVVAQITFSEKLHHSHIQHNFEQKYDSLQNINIRNVMSHIGQTICYVGDTTALKNGWTSDFYSDFTCKDVYRPKQVVDGFKMDVIRTDYQSIVGRYFRVCDVYDYNPESELDKKFRLQLVDDEKSDTIYWKWEPHPQYSFSDFITLGYFEKMKQKYVDDTMILKLTHYRIILQNGLKTDIIKGSKFKCIDIVMTLHDSSSMRAILENDKYGKIEAYFKGVNDFSVNDFYSQRHIDECIRKYGIKYGKQVGSGQIDIGMSKAMVKDAYGKPDKINSTTLEYTQSEQWLYTYDDYMVFVYFENGKVVAIQD